MIRALRSAFPKSRIAILAGSSYGTEFVLENSNLIDETKILIQESSFLEKIKFAFELRKEKYDLIILPFDATPDFLILQSLIADIPIRIGHHWREIPDDLRRLDPSTIFLTHPVALKAGRHEIDLNLDLLIPLGITDVKNRETFFSTPADISVSLPARYWSVQLGAANAILSVKRWDVAKFAAVLDILIERYQIPVVALGDKYEREIYQHVQDLMKHDLIDCVGKTTIQEVAAIIKYSQVLLCHDSGLMHIAVALKTPVVALFGPTDYTRTAPLGPHNQIIRKNLECSPCMYAFGRSEEEVADKCIHRNCMRDIEVEEVVDAVSRIIERSTPISS
jgi:heptosyltransferase-2